ncbi:pentatricopeptide repeat-containing protein At5g39680 [Fagus crenata]
MAPPKLPTHFQAPFLFKPNFLPDPIKFLKKSAETKNLRQGKILHALLITTTQPPQNGETFETNLLINFYAKCDQISVARQLFDEMPERNVVSWSALMAGYLHNGLSLEVLRLFKKMVLVENLRLNEYVFAIVLSSCSDSRRVEEGKQCHGYVLKSGLVFHQYVKNALIHMYSRCLDVDGAMWVLNTVPGYDVFSYNSVINGLIELGYLREALEVLDRMMGEFVVWDNVTYVTVFGLCARLKDLKLGLQVHGQMLKSDLECDVFVSSAMVDMYGKCGKILNARKVFDCLQNRNVVSWTSIMAAYFQNGYFEEALNLFSKMEIEDTMPNEYTFAVLLNSSAGLSALRLGDLLHARAEKSGFKDHVIVGNALVIMYSKTGNIKEANKIFSDMIFRDTITWNAMICGYSHHGLGKEALIVFQDMLAAGVCPNYVTFIGVLSACAHSCLVQEGFYYLNHLMEQMGIEPGLEHYTCIVGLLSRAGLLDEAENFMRSTPVKWDVIAWRTLLNACHVHRNYEVIRSMSPHLPKNIEHSLWRPFLWDHMLWISSIGLLSYPDWAVALRQGQTYDPERLQLHLIQRPLAEDRKPCRLRWVNKLRSNLKNFSSEEESSSRAQSCSSSCIKNSEMIQMSIEQQVEGSLNLIDLAGSGRLSTSGATEVWRESLLYIGGAAKMLMFPNISLCPSSVVQSLISLEFAKNILRLLGGIE